MTKSYLFFVLACSGLTAEDLHLTRWIRAPSSELLPPTPNLASCGEPTRTSDTSIQDGGGPCTERLRRTLGPGARAWHACAHSVRTPPLPPRRSADQIPVQQPCDGLWGQRVLWARASPLFHQGIKLSLASELNSVLVLLVRATPGRKPLARDWPQRAGNNSKCSNYLLLL